MYVHKRQLKTFLFLDYDLIKVRVKYSGCIRKIQYKVSVTNSLKQRNVIKSR